MIKLLLFSLLLFLVSCANLPEDNSSTMDEQASKDGSKIDREGIRQTFISHQKELQVCYETALKNNKDIEGKIVFDFVIGPEGKVSKAQVDTKRSTLVSEDLGGCIQKHILSWTFPSPPAKQDVQVYYPMSFSKNKK